MRRTCVSCSCLNPPENESERKRLLDENVELQSRIRELQKEKAISRNLSASALFAEGPIVKRFHEIAVQPLANVKEEEWAELTDTFANSYPDLFLDLCQYCNTPQSIRVCMLTVMGLGWEPPVREYPMSSWLLTRPSSMNHPHAP